MTVATVVVLVPTAVNGAMPDRCVRTYTYHSLFARLRHQALRLTVVMGASTNGNRIANLRRGCGVKMPSALNSESGVVPSVSVATADAL